MAQVLCSRTRCSAVDREAVVAIGQVHQVAAAPAQIGAGPVAVGGCSIGAHIVVKDGNVGIGCADGAYRCVLEGQTHLLAALGHAVVGDLHRHMLDGFAAGKTQRYRGGDGGVVRTSCGRCNGGGAGNSLDGGGSRVVAAAGDAVGDKAHALCGCGRDSCSGPGGGSCSGVVVAHRQAAVGHGGTAVGQGHLQVEQFGRCFARAYGGGVVDEGHTHGLDRFTGQEGQRGVGHGGELARVQGGGRCCVGAVEHHAVGRHIARAGDGEHTRTGRLLRSGHLRHRESGGGHRRVFVVDGGQGNTAAVSDDPLRSLHKIDRQGLGRGVIGLVVEQWHVHMFHRFTRCEGQRAQHITHCPGVVNAGHGGTRVADHIHHGLGTTQVATAGQAVSR